MTAFNLPNSSSTRTEYVYPFLAKPLPESREAKDVVSGLKEALQGSSAEVSSREDDSFESSASIFNGAVKTYALAIVKPRNALDVSKTVKFCRAEGLQLSVKAGGTGVHGGSVAGHVIVDLSLLNEVSVALPTESPSLSESNPSKRPSNGSKRSAEDDLPDGSIRGKARSQSQAGSLDGLNESDGDFQSFLASLDGPSPSTTNSTGSMQTPPVLPQPRMTYVNPSPTSTSAYPFVSSSFGGAPSVSDTASWNSFEPQRLMLNINADPPPYTIATFGAGVKSKQLDAATAASPFGAYHVPTSAFPVGSGQFLSGGFGFIGRKHGLAMDNVVEAEIVLADGRIIYVSEDSHSGEWNADEDPRDVWYALRGAGAMLGVVTRFRAKAFYLPSVYAGNLIYAFGRDTTPGLLRHLRDCIKGAPRTVYCNIIMTAGPTGDQAIVVIQLCFSGPRSEGDTYVQAISSYEGATLVFRDFSERTFERQQVAVEEILRGGFGRKWYIKSGMLKSLSDEVIDETCDRFSNVPDGCTWLFEYTGSGATMDVKDTCWPDSHRESAFTVAALHQWGHTEPPPQDNQCVLTAEEWIDRVILPNSPGGPLPCFLQSATHDAVRGTFGSSYYRLARIKEKFDPDYFFQHAMWPRPGSPRGGPGEETQLIGQPPPVREKGKGKSSPEFSGKENGINGYATNGHVNGNGVAAVPLQSATEAARDLSMRQKETPLVVDPTQSTI